ncbi:MAG: M10 family metallopeptidase C-terminal domain-containing protein [Gemmobacter sp.]|uniref:calcium-binding protein n=1 Tax=Gemmobacter sp. TaxID=1898957 RepID=UPI001A63EC56|nr:M10 family metallopeptidase C-terminal domain-containing protein [Gemmobacter sp.]MBL8561355.1 M10 family metallopeptidase C-terminal domain-containing protein [Gemmobacter sp.]
MSDSDRYQFTFDAEGVATAVFEAEDGGFEPDSLDADESYTLHGAAVLHLEHEGEAAEWALLLPEAEGSDIWVEVIDGHGHLDPALIPEILARLGEGTDDGAGGDDDDDDDDDRDDDGDDDDGGSGHGDDDGLIGGDTYRFVFAEDGRITAIYEVEDDGAEERDYISPDETYTRVGDLIVKVESDDDGPEWEIYGPLAGTDLWVELADGRGEIALDAASLAALIAAEDGVATSPDNDDDDEYRGDDSDDDFDGGSDDDGDDCYIGGAGEDDVAFGGDTAVTVNLRKTGFQETGRGFDRFVGIENLTGGSGHDLLEGNGRGNRLAGGAGDDRLRGGGGDDGLAGGRGDDRLVGGRGDDALAGGRGDDRLHGGHGRDLLRGGEGADTFVFASVAEIGRGAARDRITDFERGEDHVDLSALDLAFIGRDRFAGEGEAEVRISVTRQGVNLLGDTDGDGRADFMLTLKGLKGFDADDLIL